jgi:hypothetical protein
VVLVVLWWQSRQPPIGTPEHAQPGATSEPQAGGGSAESADAPAAASVGPQTTEHAAGIAPAEETAEPPQAASDIAGESAGESDGQPPQAAISTEQSIGSDSAHPEAPPGDDTQAGEPPTETPISSQGISTTTAAGSETAGETASDTVGEGLGETDSATQSVAVAPDTVEADGSDNNAGLEEQTPLPAPLAGSDLLAIRLARESWVEIYDRGGGRLYYNLAQEGSEVVVQGAGPMRVLLGDVEGATVAYNGEPYDLGRYQGRSVVRFTIGNLSSTAAPVPAPTGAQ